MTITRRAAATAFLTAGATIALLGYAPRTGPGAQRRNRSSPLRVVSLAPSVTEILFAIGVGDQVVGVTSYCRYPPAVADVAKVGGYLTPNYEVVAALRPDVVVVLPEHRDLHPPLVALGVDLLEVDHHNIDGILGSIQVIGDRVGAGPPARRLVSELNGRLQAVARTVGGRPLPRVVVSLGQSGDRLRSTRVAGPGGIYHDLVRHAGGRNAVPAGPVLHPAVSTEGVLQLRPDVVVEFAPGARDASALRTLWQSLASMAGLADDRVVIFTDHFLQVPGPRLIMFVAELARAIHPGAAWESR